MTASALDAHEYLVEVFISLNPAVNDPEGLAIRSGLHTLGFDEVDGVRSGKYLQLTVRAGSEAEAARRVGAMCERLLANTVIEQYRVAASRLVAS